MNYATSKTKKQKKALFGLCLQPLAKEKQLQKPLTVSRFCFYAAITRVWSSWYPLLIANFRKIKYNSCTHSFIILFIRICYCWIHTQSKSFRSRRSTYRKMDLNFGYHFALKISLQFLQMNV